MPYFPSGLDEWDFLPPPTPEESAKAKKDLEYALGRYERIQKHRDQRIRMTALVHPFQTKRKVLEFRPGRSVLDMVSFAQPDRAKLRHAVVFINGKVIPRQAWNEHKPVEGELVEVRAFPVPMGGGGGGGGKNILSIVLMIAVVAISAGGASWLVGAAKLAGTAWGSAMFAFSTALFSTVGMLAVNALCPVASGKNSSIAALSGSDTTTDSNTLYIEGASNSIDPFGVVPVVLGQYRQTPRQGSKPYTEIIGEDQYIRMLFVWGIGPISIDLTTLKIGDTLLSEFSDYQIEHREGYADDAALTLFPGAISEEDFTIALSEAGGWISRTTAIDSDEISVDISFSNGLVSYDSQGSKQQRTVNVEVQYRETGTETWHNIDTTAAKFQTTFDATWLTVADGLLTSVNFTAKKTSALRFGIRWGVAERGQYDVQVRRTTADNESSMIQDGTYWTALRSIKAESPVLSPIPLAMTALVIKATDQLNGIINDFTGVVTRVCEDWDSGTSTWIERVSQNPASAFRYVLQGGGVASPLADSRIDLEALQEFHEFCEEKGYKFNQVRDYSSSVWETLRDICAAGRAAPTITDGKWSVVIDREQTAPVSIITPRNSFDFSAEKFFLDPPHGWRIQFTNEDEGYKTDEYRVYRDGYTDDNATKFESLSLIGVTDPDQIYKLGRWRIAQFLNQPERWTFKQDMEFLTYRRGDWIKIAHDVMIVGLATGRVKSIATNAGNAVVSIILDEEVTMASGKTYGAVIRTLTDPSLSAQVTTVVGSTNSLVFTTPIAGTGSPAEPVISVGDLVCFGEFGEETEDAHVISITPDSNLQATVVAVPYRPAIYNCDTESIPAFVTKIVPSEPIPAPNITSIVSDATAIVITSTGFYKIRVGINFDPLNAYIYGDSSVEVQMRKNGTGENYYPAVVEEYGKGYVFIGDVVGGDVIDIRLRFRVNSNLIPGPWATDLSYAVIGKDAPPSNVTGFLVKQSRDRLTCVWNEVTDFDTYGYEIRQGSSWEAGIVLGTGITQNSFISLFITTGVAQNFWIKAIDTSGNYSATATQAILTVDNVPFTNIIQSYSEQTAWAGTKTNVAKVGNNLELDCTQLPTLDTDHVKATTMLDAGVTYQPWGTTDPSKSLTGTWANNWISANGTATNQRFHIDIGSAKVIKRFYYENCHHQGAYTGGGVKNFTLWGSNDAGAFAELTYGVDTNWTQLATSQATFDIHRGTVSGGVSAPDDISDPKYISVTNAVAYRYYAFKFADTWDATTGFAWMSVRRIELQEANLTGTYLTPVRDIGYVATFKVGVEGISVAGGDSTWQSFGEQRFNELADTIRFLGVEQAGALTYEINYSEDNLVWSGWQPWIPADYKCRYFQIRMTMTRASTAISLICSTLNYFADLPDIDEMQNLTISNAVAGVAVTFAKTFHESPGVNVTILSGTGVYHTVASLNTLGVTIKLFDVAGTAQTGNIRIHVHGI